MAAFSTLNTNYVVTTPMLTVGGTKDAGWGINTKQTESSRNAALLSQFATLTTFVSTGQILFMT